MLALVVEQRHRLCKERSSAANADTFLSAAPFEAYPSSVDALRGEIIAEQHAIAGITDFEWSARHGEDDQMLLDQFEATIEVRHRIAAFLCNGILRALNALFQEIERRQVMVQLIINSEPERRQYSKITYGLIGLNWRLLAATARERRHQMWNLKRRVEGLPAVPRLADLIRNNLLELAGGNALSAQEDLHVA